MAEQPNHGQPNQQPPYRYAGPARQQPGYQGPPAQQAYNNPYGQQQQYGAPQQGYPQQQPYPQVPPQQQPYPGQQQYQGQNQQQYQGQPYPGQQYPGQQFPGQQFPGQPPQGPDQNQPKPKKKRSGWWTFFIVLFSPFIALAFVAYAVYWVLCWLLTPVALVVHFVLCGIGLIWFSLVKVLASGGSKYRLFQPVYPKFPQLWTGQYWVRLNRNVRNTFEGLAAVAQLLDW